MEPPGKLQLQHTESQNSSELGAVLKDIVSTIKTSPIFRVTLNGFISLHDLQKSCFIFYCGKYT